MGRIGRFAALLLNPRVLTIVGLLLLLLVVFYGGRILDANGYTALGTTGWILMCLLVIAIAAGVVLWQRYQAMKRSRAIEQRLHAQARDQAASVRPDRRPEVEALERQLQDALDALKSSRLGRGALYGLPWYVIVGPPGSGKTTMLQESGLNFPYTSQAGRGIRGVGGTRNCDWWFTDQGILLDTAGRYTTEEEDHDEWLSFLQMLRRARKRKPINGAIVAIGIDELATAEDAELHEHATKIRKRIEELTKHLELVFPVYVVLTKCDLLDGFVPFFENMTRDQRAQVWGTTLDGHDQHDPSPQDVLMREFDRLVERLDARRLGLLATDRPAVKQQKVFAFPLQLRAMRDRVADFLRELCQPNPYQESASVRGLYLTSGTQEGEPIDQVLRELGAALGVEAPQAAGHDDGQAKSYFIDHLFTEVIFPDQDLARSSAKVERRRTLARRGLLYGSIAATVLLAVALIVSYVRSSNLIGTSRGTVAAAERILEPRERELQAAYAANQLDHWRRRRDPDDAEKAALAALADHFVKLDDAPWGLLGKADRLYERARKTYIRAIREFFLYPLEGYLRQTLNAAIDQTATPTKDEIIRFQNLLAAYQLISGKAEPMDRERLAEVLEVESLWNWRSSALGIAPSSGADRSENRHRDILLKRLFGYRSPPDWIVEGIDEKTRLRALDHSRLLDRVGSEIEKYWASRRRNDSLEHLVPSRVEQETEAIVERINEASSDAEEREQNKERVTIKSRELVLADIRSYLLRLKPASFPNLNDASAALARKDLVVRQDNVHDAAYREAMGKLREFDMVDAAAGGTDTEWIGSALKAIAGLQTAISTYVGGRDIGSRIIPDALNNNAEGLQRLVREIKLVRDQVSGLAENANAKVRDAVREVLIGYVDAVEAGLRAEALDEASVWWRSYVGNRFRGLANKYPFDPEGEPLAMSELTEVLNPSNGRYAQAIATLDRLAALPNVFGYAREFATERVRIEAIQRCLFHDGSVFPLMPFHARLSKHDDLQDVEFTLRQGDGYAVRFKSSDDNVKNLESIQRRWTQDCRGAAIRGKFREGDWESVTGDVGDSAWSLFRLMATGEPEPRVDVGMSVGSGPKYGRVWTIQKRLTTGPAVGRVRLLIATLTPENPFVAGFFTLSFAEPVQR